VKRYLLFSGTDYYPSGGWNDFDDSFDSAEAAKVQLDATTKDNYKWGHVIDSQTGKCIHGEVDDL